MRDKTKTSSGTGSPDLSMGRIEEVVGRCSEDEGIADTHRLGGRSEPAVLRSSSEHSIRRKEEGRRWLWRMNCFKPGLWPLRGS